MSCSTACRLQPLSLAFFIQLEELFHNRTSLYAGTTAFGAFNCSLLMLCYQYFFSQLLLTAAIERGDHHFNCTVPRSRTGNATNKTPDDYDKRMRSRANAGHRPGKTMCFLDPLLNSPVAQLRLLDFHLKRLTAYSAFSQLDLATRTHRVHFRSPTELSDSEAKIC